MSQIAALKHHSREQDIAQYEKVIREAESFEIELRERRSYSIDPSDVILCMFGIPTSFIFLGACVWAIASNG